MLQDIRLAARQLLKSPGFSIVAVLTLAIAIGANTAIFSAVDAVLLHPLPYPEPDRLMTVTENLPHYSLRGLQPSFSEFLEYRRMAACFSAIAAVTGGDATLTGEGQPEDVDAKRVSSAAFPMIGITSVLGGLFTTEDEQYGKDHVVILSEGLWRRRYGGDRAIIGKNIRTTGRATAWRASSSGSWIVISRLTCGCRSRFRPRMSRREAVDLTTSA